MADDQDQDQKTEDPTARRLEKAKEEGQVLRSQEASIAAVTVGVISTLYALSFWIAPVYKELFRNALIVDFREAFDAGLALTSFGKFVSEAFLVALPVFAVAVFIAIATGSLLGGFVFTLKAVSIKPEKLNPIKGLARIFGPRALVELMKAILKFSLVGGIAYLFLFLFLSDFYHIARSSSEQAIPQTLGLVLFGALITSSALIFIALVDIPYQRFEFIKKLKMSRKDIKDELKDMMGQPEVRQKIRQKQRELAEARMLQDVPQADVIITNPQHFAVALAYSVGSDDAPSVVAKGQGHIALRIREIGVDSKVEIFEAPPLARALYFTVEVGEFIPADLFQSVAQVIAYVYSLKNSHRRLSGQQKPNPKVPKGFRFNELGKLESRIT